MLRCGERCVRVDELAARLQALSVEFGGTDRVRVTRMRVGRLVRVEVRAEPVAQWQLFGRQRVGARRTRFGIERRPRRVFGQIQVRVERIRRRALALRLRGPNVGRAAARRIAARRFRTLGLQIALLLAALRLERAIDVRVRVRALVRHAVGVARGHVFELVF